MPNKSRHERIVSVKSQPLKIGFAYTLNGDGSLHLPSDGKDENEDAKMITHGEDGSA